MTELTALPAAAALTGAELLPALQAAGAVKVQMSDLCFKAELAASRLYGQKAAGAAGALTPAEALTILGLATADSPTFAGMTLTGALTGSALSLTGNATLGDAAGDNVTINAGTVTIPNGLNFDANTFVIDAANNRVGIGLAAPGTRFEVQSVGADTWVQKWLNSSGVQIGGLYQTTGGYGLFDILNGGVSKVRLDAGGGVSTVLNMQCSGVITAGTATVSSGHTLTKPGSPQGTLVATIDCEGSAWGVYIHGGTQGGFNAAATVMKVGANGSTGRAINAAGTVNASGADYAEYRRKSAGCSSVLKGQVCGYDSNGAITDRWADMVRPRVKSTDPSYVGGDRWGAISVVGDAPHEPIFNAIEPMEPGEEPEAPERPVRGEEEDDVSWTGRLLQYAAVHSAWEQMHDAWRRAFNAYPQLRTDWLNAVAAHEQAMEAYEADFADFQARLEAERVKYDRIAYCGRVPCIVSGPVAAGDYVVAVQDGDGIKAVAVADYTAEQRRFVVGIVSIANPTEGQFRELISEDIPIDPAWSAIVEVVTL